MEKKFLQKLYLIGFLTLFSSLLYYQVIKGNYYLEKALNNYVKLIPIDPIRGSIFDRNGEALAYDRASFNIAVFPYQVKNNKDVLFKEIARFLNYDLKIIENNYRREFKNWFTPVNIILDIDKATAFKLKEKFGEEVFINVVYKRHYLYPFELSHILGYVKEASSFYDYLKSYGYTPLERVGFLGIEQFYDPYLKGNNGGQVIEVNAKGDFIGFIGEKKPIRGKDIYLTIDSRIQKIAYELLKEKKGVIILMDSFTGEILSLVSFPSFNLNSFVEGKHVEFFLNDKDKCMYNRAIQALYPLGSTFKPIVGVAALEEKKINPHTNFKCEGRLIIGNKEFKCQHSHGLEDLYKGLAHSCNIYFYNLGMLLGVKKITEWAKKFGLNSYTGVDLPYEKKGLTTIQSLLAKQWFAGDLLNLSIGQGYIEATPLEIMVAINAFSNGGYLVKPHIVKKIEDSDVKSVEKTYIEMDSKNLEHIKTGLIKVVEEKNGTGRLLKKLNLKIAGKTGTAQTRGRPHGWFIGFFPYHKPKYTICVFLENAGSSYKAVEITYEFLKKLKEENLL